MRTFQVSLDGVRICRIFVNCRATSRQICEALFGTSLSFYLADKYGKEEGREYCGLAEFQHRLKKTGSFVEVYEVEEGTADD